MPIKIRPFHPADLPAMYRICLLTGDAGTDASGMYANPDLLAHLYCGPYPVADPGLSFVAVDERGVAGYVVATADTRTFDDWLERAWWPTLRAQYPRVADPGDGTQDHVLVDRFHDWAHATEALDATHPAHLHIDLLPRAQGQGLGRRLIETLADALRARDVPGVHLGVAEENAGAIGFYGRVGFREASRHPGGRVLVRDL